MASINPKYIKYEGGYGNWRDEHLTKDLYNIVGFGNLTYFEKLLWIDSKIQQLKQGGVLRDIMREMAHRKMHEMRRNNRLKSKKVVYNKKAVIYKLFA